MANALIPLFKLWLTDIDHNCLNEINELSLCDFKKLKSLDVTGGYDQNKNISIVAKLETDKLEELRVSHKIRQKRV